VLGALVLALGTRLPAQVSPNADWHTLRTTHFFVHFTPPVESLARRIAGDAERAYTELSRELHPPRGMIDVVISDDQDVSNGSATPFPTNRIVIYANPPVSESALRYTNDWGQLVITHELTHIFHLDRARGVWALSQKVFGRAAALFPNSYSPSWLVEGLAVYEESKLTGAGRIEGSEHRMIARAAAIDHRFPSIGALSLAQGRFPFGEYAYGYGSLFVDYLARTRGESKVRDFVEKSSADIIPYLVDIPARQGFGVSFSQAWREFGDSIKKSVEGVSSRAEARSAAVEGPPGSLGGRDRRSLDSLRSLGMTSGSLGTTTFRDLTKDGTFVLAPRWLDDNSLIYSGTPGRESFGAYRVDLNGKRTRVGRRNSRSANVPLANHDLLYSQIDFVNYYQTRTDLWIQHGSHEKQITFGQRLTTPDARADGEIVAQQIIPGATRLVRVSPDGRRITPITTGSYDEQWTEPRWSTRGDRIAAVRWLRGNLSQIVVLDSTGRLQAIVASARAIQATPSWAPNDSGVYFSSDVTGEAQVYFARANGDTYRISQVPTGLFEPQARGSEIASVLFRADGYHLGVSPCCAGTLVSPLGDTVPRTEALLVDSSRATKYSPWRTFVPRYWIPTIEQSIRGGQRLGAETSGFDVVGRHALNASIQIPTDNTGVTGSASYQYAGFGMPILQLDANQDWQWLGTAFSRDAARTPLGDVYRRTWTGDALATYVRSRVRTSMSLTGGFGIEHRLHTVTNGVPLASIDTNGTLGAPTFPSFIAGAGFANFQRPPFSISPEDGVQFNVTFRDRFNSEATGRGGSSYSTVATAAVYKSLDLPGFAHHVIALRGAAGIADERSASYYSVGGISGSTYNIIPGYVIGEGRKTFPVRGFEPGTLLGTRAFTGTAEYRIPLFLTGNSPGILPFFLDRSSLTLFGDYGTAWCPNIATGREVCNQTSQLLTQRTDIASVGAELNLTLGVLSWDSPYRLRIGLVTPTHNQAFFQRTSWQMYVVGGISF
jgi:hypothetical protein